jgi:serine/threonine protein kinase
MEKTMTRSSLLRKRFFKDEAPEIVPVKIKGQGAFGMVFEAIDPKLKKRVAVKRMRKSDFKASRELLILEQLCKSKGCVQMLDAFYTVNKKKQLTQNVVMEYIDDSLENFINSHKKRGMYIPVEILKNLMKQLLEGLKGVHSKDICHRDLKPDNILINKKEEVKICDFGCSKTLVPDSKRNNIPHIVSRYYRAPELILCHVKYSVKVDLWALGCIFIELFTRNPLFPGATEGLQFLEQIAVLGTNIFYYSFNLFQLTLFSNIPNFYF